MLLPIDEIVKQINDVLGEGYAREHPELLSACLIADSLREIDHTFAQTVEILDSRLGRFL